MRALKLTCSHPDLLNEVLPANVDLHGKAQRSINTTQATCHWVPFSGPTPHLWPSCLMRSHNHVTSPFMGRGGSNTIHRAECSPVRASTAHPPHQTPSALQLDRVGPGLEGLPELGGKVSSHHSLSQPPRASLTSSRVATSRSLTTPSLSSCSPTMATRGMPVSSQYCS